MKAKLIKQGNEYFLRSLIKDIPSSINVYHKISKTEGEFGFGKHSGKLCKQNCDEIFCIIDVEKLAKQKYPNVDNEDYEYDSEWQMLADEYKQRGFIQGAKEILELNKDKLFTAKDMHDAVMLGVCFENPGIRGISNYNEAKDLAIKRALEPTEIEVEIVMDRIPVDLAPDGWDVFPKLDENNCLILKRVV